MNETREFDDRFTVFPDTGVIELNCFKCKGPGGPGTRGTDTWPVGYHPSLDVLVEQARAHNQEKHGAAGPPTHAEWLKTELNIPNWTSHEGRENSSREFRQLCREVSTLIASNGGSSLSRAWADMMGGLIMAQLAHVHGLAPQVITDAEATARFGYRPGGTDD